MAIWINKKFGSAPFDVVLRAFGQHYYAMGGDEEMLMLISSAIGDTQVFIRLPELDYRFLYPGFETCAEDELPDFFKLVAGSESEYSALVQKRTTSGKVVTEPAKEPRPR